MIKLPRPVSKQKLEAANALFTAKLEAHLDAGQVMPAEGTRHC